MVAIKLYQTTCCNLILRLGLVTSASRCVYTNSNIISLFLDYKKRKVKFFHLVNFVNNSLFLCLNFIAIVYRVHMFSSKRPVEDIEMSEDTTTHKKSKVDVSDVSLVDCVMKNDSAMLKDMLKKVTEREA